MAVIYDGIVSSGHSSGHFAGDVISMPLSSVVPASTPTESVAISLLIVQLNDFFTLSDIAFAPLIYKAPNFYNYCWSQPHGLGPGQFGSGEVDTESFGGWWLNYYPVMEDNSGPLTLTLEATTINSGVGTTVYWEIRQYRNLEIVAGDSLPLSTTPFVNNCTGFSGGGSLPSTDDTSVPFTGTIDGHDPITEETGTISGTPSNAGLSFVVEIGYGETNTGGILAEFDTPIEAIDLHDARFTDETFIQDEIIKLGNTWSFAFKFAHILNPTPGDDILLGADFTHPVPASATFTGPGGTQTNYSNYPVGGYGYLIAEGAGPAACSPTPDYIKVFRHQHKAEAEATPFGGGSTPVGVFSQTPSWKP
jgi:hypothetical protein